jgi:hypothetical protein
MRTPDVQASVESLLGHSVSKDGELDVAHGLTRRRAALRVRGLRDVSALADLLGLEQNR